MEEHKLGKGIYVLNHCSDPECGSISIAMISPDIREVTEIAEALAPVIDVDVDQALDMAEALIRLARSKLIHNKEEE